MKLIIDIPLDVYERCKNGNYELFDDVVRNEAVANGTPINKGHGRLIDADELKKHEYYDTNRYQNAVAFYYIDGAPTIVEADKDETDN